MLPGNRNGIATIYNEELNLRLPIPLKKDNNNNNKFSDIDIFNVAFPKYVKRNPYFSQASIIKDSITKIDFQLAQNYEDVAFKTLRDRTLREIGKVAIRLGTKKISEYLVKDKNEDLGAVLGIFNALSEHADTRNWQSLPNRIYYIRIPLREGENSISISISPINGLSKEQTIKIEGRKGIQFKRITTLRSF